MGGGRKNFRTVANGGNRVKDDLVQHFLENGGTYLQNTGDLNSWNNGEKTLGLFSDSHMEWEVNRAKVKLSFQLNKGMLHIVACSIF